MHSQQMRRSHALLAGLAIAIPGCTGEPAIRVEQETQALGAPPGSSNEAVFAHEYSDIVIGRGIRTVTSTRTAGPCIKLPDTVKYEVGNREWTSESMAVANQAELARKLNLDANMALAHGDSSVNLGLKALRDLDWKSASMKLVIRVLYTYDVVLGKPDEAELTQAAYDALAPPAANDSEAQRETRARAFLKTCGRYWAKGAKKGAELLIVYSLNNVRTAQQIALGTTVAAAVPATTTAGGDVKLDQQQAFKNAIQGASLKVYARGFKVSAGDPLLPIAQGMDPAATNQAQLTTLTGFFNDIKESVNRNYESDSGVMANPIASNTDARKIAMIGQHYQPLFRTPRAGAGGTLPTWAGTAQTDLFTQDNALYTMISQYTAFLTAARSAERTASYVRGHANDGHWNFATDPERDIAAVQARMDRLRDTIRIVENATGPAERNRNGGLDTDAQETGHWARRCWDLVVQGNEPETCFRATEFYNRAQLALTAFRNGLAKPLNFFSLFFTRDPLGWSVPKKAVGRWTTAEGWCKHAKSSKLMPLDLKLPTAKELDAFGPFMSGTPSHAKGLEDMEFSEKYLWESSRFIVWEWKPTDWIFYTYTGGYRSNPDHPWACIRKDGPFAMPVIMF